MSTEAMKARKPLAAAKVEVIPNEENPGYYNARFFLRPHFQLEGDGYRSQSGIAAAGPIVLTLAAFNHLNDRK